MEVASKLNSCFSVTFSEHMERHQWASKIVEARPKPKMMGWRV
jgi:hypothetical protein